MSAEIITQDDIINTLHYMSNSDLYENVCHEKIIKPLVSVLKDLPADRLKILNTAETALRDAKEDIRSALMCCSTDNSTYMSDEMVDLVIQSHCAILSKTCSNVDQNWQ